jgi:hypothetical protein
MRRGSAVGARAGDASWPRTNFVGRQSVAISPECKFTVRVKRISGLIYEETRGVLNPKVGVAGSPIGALAIGGSSPAATLAAAHPPCRQHSGPFVEL